jgi:hypothetical protein
MNYPFFINIHKVLFTGNARLFFNTLPHMQAGIFPDPCHEISNVGLIRLVVGSNTMKKFHQFFINIPKVLSIDNVRLFINSSTLLLFLSY